MSFFATLAMQQPSFAFRGGVWVCRFSSLVHGVCVCVCVESFETSQIYAFPATQQCGVCVIRKSVICFREFDESTLPQAKHDISPHMGA